MYFFFKIDSNWVGWEIKTLLMWGSICLFLYQFRSMNNINFLLKSFRIKWNNLWIWGRLCGIPVVKRLKLVASVICFIDRIIGGHLLNIPEIWCPMVICVCVSYPIGCTNIVQIASRRDLRLMRQRLEKQQSKVCLFVILFFLLCLRQQRF